MYEIDSNATLPTRRTRFSAAPARRWRARIRIATIIVTVAGVAIHVNLYYERHLYIYDLVGTEGVRSKGYGGMLMGHAEGIARRERCETAALACGLEREGALRLYEGRGYEKPSYGMRKALR